MTKLPWLKLWCATGTRFIAERIFHERLSELLPQATWVDGIPKLSCTAHDKAMGSCSAKGNLMLNPHLIKTPKMY